MSKSARFGFGIANFMVAILVAWSVFRGLPTRWWPVDGGAALVAALMCASGALLVLEHEQAPRITRIAAGVTLALGLALMAALISSAAWLWGQYGAIGKGGASIFGLICLMVFPYLIALPAAELVWVGPGKKEP